MTLIGKHYHYKSFIFRSSVQYWNMQMSCGIIVLNKKNKSLRKFKLKQPVFLLGQQNWCLRKLYDEIDWETLETRRRKHKLVFFYKMFHNLSPLYLSSLVPPLVQNASRYSLRNVQTVALHTNQYFHSFLPSAIREWNTLSEDIRNAHTIESFKRRINQDMITIPKHFFMGSHQLQIRHTRLRTGSLNNDLFLKTIVDSP